MISYMIRPVEIGLPQIVSTTAMDPTPAWNAGTAYGLLAEVHVGDRKYFSMAKNNTGHDPVETVGAYWADDGPINPLAMFDGMTSSTTEASSPLTVVLQVPGWVDSFAVFDVTGTALQFKVEDGANVVRNLSISLIDDEPIFDFFDYLFEELTYVRDKAVLGIPLTPNPKITMTISGGAKVKCGALFLGTSLAIGTALIGSSVGSENLSIIERNEISGKLSVTERPTLKEGSFDVHVPDGRGAFLNNVYRALGARTAVWVMNAKDSRTIIAGYLRSYKFNLSRRNDEHCAMDISGV